MLEDPPAQPVTARRWSWTHALVFSVFAVVAVAIFGFAWYARNFAGLLRMLDRQEAGDQAQRQGRPKEAEIEYRRALGIGERLQQRQAQDVRFRELLPGLHARMGGLAERRGDRAVARTECQTALDLLAAAPSVAPDPKAAPHLDLCREVLAQRAAH